MIAKSNKYCMTQINTSELDNAIQELGSSLSSIINRALTVDDMRMQSLTSVEFNVEEGKEPYGKGLMWKSTDSTKQLIYKPNPNRFWSSETIDLDRNAAYSIGNATVLSTSELGPTVTTSNLTKVGVINNLRTQGDLVIDEEIFYNAGSGRIGFGTDSPNGILSVASMDGEFIIDSTASSTRFGNWTNTDLEVITDDTTRLVVRANGIIEIGNPENNNATLTVHGKLGVGVNNVSNDITFASVGPIKFQNKKFEVSDEIPTNGTYRVGDIVWNSVPQPTGYIGWVCMREGTPGEWLQFGKIG